MLAEWNDLLGNFVHCMWSLGNDTAELDDVQLDHMDLISRYVLKGALVTQSRDSSYRLSVKKMRFLNGGNVNGQCESISISFVFDGLKYSRYSHDFIGEAEFTPVPMALTFVVFSSEYEPSQWGRLSALISEYIDFVILSVRSLQTKLMISSDTWLPYCGDANVMPYRGSARDFVNSIDVNIDFWFKSLVLKNQTPGLDVLTIPSLDSLHLTLPQFDESVLISIITMYLCTKHILFIHDNPGKYLAVASLLQLLSAEAVATNVISRFGDFNFSFNITGFETNQDFDLDLIKTEILKAPFPVVMVDLRKDRIVFSPILKSQFFNIRREYLRQLASDSFHLNFALVLSDKKLFSAHVTKIVFLLSQVTDVSVARMHLDNWHSVLRSKAALIEKTIDYIYEKYQQIICMSKNDSMPSLSAMASSIRSHSQTDMVSQSGNTSPTTVILDSENQSSTRSTPLHSRAAQYHVQTNVSSTTVSSRVPSPSLTSETPHSQLTQLSPRLPNTSANDFNDTNRKQSVKRIKARKRTLVNDLMSMLTKISACQDLSEVRTRGRSMASDNHSTGSPARPSTTDNSASHELTGGYYETFKGIFKSPMFHWLSMDGPWNYPNALLSPESQEHADMMFFDRMLWGDDGIKSSFKHELQSNADLLLLLNMTSDPAETSNKLLHLLSNK